MKTSYKINFYGALVNEFNTDSAEFSVRNTEELLRLLEANRPGVLRKWFKTGMFVIYVNETLVTTTNVRTAFKPGDTIHIVPVVAGSFVEVVLGIIAIVAILAAILVAFTSIPSDDLSDVATSPQGDINVAKAGAMVPIAYGEVKVGSLVASSERGVGRLSSKILDTQPIDPYLDYLQQQGKLIDYNEFQITVPKASKSKLREGAVRSRILHALSEGPIEAIDKILFDGSEAPEDIPELSVITTQGHDPQELLPSFETSSTPTSLNINITTTRRVAGVKSNSDQASFIFKISSFFETKKNKPKATSVQLVVEKRELGAAAWETVVTPVINEESFGEKVFGIDIELDNTKRWEVSVSRVSEETQDDKKQDRVQWSTLNSVAFNRVSYDGTAMAVIEYTEESFGGSNPATEFIGRWRKLKIPSNYDPETRQFTGLWDGTYKPDLAYTNNTAFVLQDLLDNNVYGLGSYLENAFDQFSLYALAVYCEELVPDGRGGQEPRFTFNGVLRERKALLKVLRDISSAVRGQAYWDGTSTQLIIDQERPVTHIANSAMVVGGSFGYQGTTIEGSPNSVKVTYLDPNNNYEKDSVIFQDEQKIAQYGLIEDELEGVGVTSKGQALRLARYATLAEGRLASFTGVEYFSGALPGSVVEVYDEGLMGVRRGGVVSEVSTVSVIHLDGTQLSLNLVDPTGSSLSVVLPNGLVESRDIQNIDYILGYPRVQVVGAFSSIPQVDSPWGIKTPDLGPISYVVQSRDSLGDGLYRLTCVEYDPRRILEADLGIKVEDREPIDSEPVNFAAPPLNLQVEQRQVSEPFGVSQTLALTWEPPQAFGSGAIVSYEVFISREGAARQFTGSTAQSYYNIQNVEEGLYTIYVRSKSEMAVSAFTTLLVEVFDTADQVVTTISGLELFEQGNDTKFINRDAKFTWRYNNPLDTQEVGDERFGADSAPPSRVLRDFTVRIYDADTNALVREEPGLQSNEYVYTFEKNSEDAAGPRRRFIFEVVGRDTFNNITEPERLEVNNPAPETLGGISVSGGIGQFTLNYEVPVDLLDFAGVVVYAGDASGFTPDLNSIIADTNSTGVITINAAPVETKFFRLAAYDTFGKDLLNLSSEFTATTQPTVLQDQSITFTGIDFEVTATNTLEWTSGTADVREDNNVTQYNVTAGSAEYLASKVYIYYVAGETFLRNTTNITQAYGVDKSVVAWYDGGNQFATQNAGGVIIDGNRISAGTIGANQLIANQAVITGSAQIANSIITNAKIDGIIESSTYNDATKQGWRLDKLGNIQGNSITIYDPLGNPIFSAGGASISSIFDAGALAGQDNINLAQVADAGVLAGQNNVNLAQVTDSGALAGQDNVSLAQVTDAGALAGQDNINLAQVTDAGVLAGLDDITLSFITNSGAFAGLNQITGLNSSTYIANAAITNALIADLNAGKITTGVLNTNRLNLNGISIINDGGQIAIADSGVTTPLIADNSTFKSVSVQTTNLLTLTQGGANVIHTVGFTPINPGGGFVVVNVTMQLTQASGANTGIAINVTDGVGNIQDIPWFERFQPSDIKSVSWPVLFPQANTTGPYTVSVDVVDQPGATIVRRASRVQITEFAK